MARLAKALILTTALLAGVGASAQDRLEVTLPTRLDPRLEAFAASDRVINAITISPQGRVFAGMPQAEGPGAQVAELKDGKFVPYPNLEWSLWKDGADPLKTLMHVNTVRIGPDGDLWIVDAGGPRVGAKAVPGAAKIIRVNLRTDTVRRTYQADSGVVREYSYFNDMRFNRGKAYITDAAALSPALVVLDIRSGRMRRVLDNHPSMIATRRMYADGGRLIQMQDPIPDPTGRMTKDKYVNVDQLEVTPDGRWLYYQPIGGPLSRVPTRLLDDPNVSPERLAAAVETVAQTGFAAGTAIDANGTIYMSNVLDRSVLTVDADHKISTLISDPRLTWVDAMWVSADGYLYMPAAQLDRTSGNLDGAPAQITYPVQVFRMKLPIKPSPIDHR